MITRKEVDAIVIGAGAAGMASAGVIAEAGYTVACVDREESAGGILLQCIHNGFGLHHFGRELTGPEYAEICSDALSSLPVQLYLDTTVTGIVKLPAGIEVVTISAVYGVTIFTAKAVVLAMGCRERNRGNIGIPGPRPAGVVTAGLAQRLLNIEGFIPGKRAVIVGSGDIGLIMARRLTWVGTDVAAVVEILPHPSGLTRNIVQCLQDNAIPLHLSHAVTRIHGTHRVEGVEIAPLHNGIPQMNHTRKIACDTILLSVGLIPENELSRRAGVVISPDTKGPVVDQLLQTSVPGIFACGNVLHVHDLVDFVTEEAQRCGRHVTGFLANGRAETAAPSLSVVPGANLKYVTPNRFAPGTAQHFFMRSLVIRDAAELTITQNDLTIHIKKLRHVRPAEMISVTVPEQDRTAFTPDEPLTFSLR